MSESSMSPPAAASQIEPEPSAVAIDGDEPAGVRVALFVGSIVSIAQRVGVAHLVLDGDQVLVRFAATRTRPPEWMIVRASNLVVIESCNAVAERDATRRLREGLMFTSDALHPPTTNVVSNAAAGLDRGVA